MNELNISVYGTFDFFGVEVWVTQTLVVTWIWMTVLIIFSFIVRKSIINWTERSKPKGLQNFVETIVEIFHSYVGNTMGENYSFFASYFFGVFLLILAFNYSGFIMQRPPTADVATTLAFASVTFFLIHFVGITKNTKNYFKSYASPFIIMLPVNIISELATPVSLCFRLFGSTLGGFIITTLAYSLLPVFLKIGFPSIIHVYFDMFAGALQAFIFITLSMTFIKDKLPEK